jgi:hypothetical protein
LPVLPINQEAQVDECVEEAPAGIPVEAPEPLRLLEGETQPRHFQELAANAHQQSGVDGGDHPRRHMDFSVRNPEKAIQVPRRGWHPACNMPWRVADSGPRS